MPKPIVQMRHRIKWLLERKRGKPLGFPLPSHPSFLLNVGEKRLLRCDRDHLHRLSDRCTLHPGASPVQRQQPLITGRQHPHIAPLA